MAAAAITWTGGAGGWQRFVQALLFAVNFEADGPAVDARRGGGRYPVGTLRITGGDGAVAVLTVRPGHTLVVPDRSRPETWSVK